MKTHVKFAIFAMIAFVIFNGLTLNAKQCNKPCDAAAKVCNKAVADKDAKPACPKTCPKAETKDCPKESGKPCPKASDKACDKDVKPACDKDAAKTCNKPCGSK